jgi:hypothetical protein
MEVKHGDVRGCRLRAHQIGQASHGLAVSRLIAVKVLVEYEGRLDITQTYPLVISGGLLRGNPFFVPPEQLLDEMRKRRYPRAMS